jgi:hypothetical protein
LNDSEDAIRRAEEQPARRWWLWVFGVTAVAFAMRLPRPPRWWLNPDEGIYFSAVADPSFSDFWTEALATAHPPLYFLVLRAMAIVTTDFGWLRAVALISAVAAVPVFIAVGRELGGPGVCGRVTGLLAGLLIAFSPRVILLSQLIRPYALLLLLLALALLALLRYSRLGSDRWLIAYAVSVSLALTLHYSAVGAFGVFLAVVAAEGGRHGLRRPAWRRLALVQLAPVATLFLLYLGHLRALMGSSMADSALDGWLALFLIGRPADLWVSIVGVHSSLVGDGLAVSASIVTLAGVAWAAWSRSWTVLVVGGSALAIATAGAAAGMYPFGGSHHTAWLFTFIAPVLAWTVAAAVVPGPLRWPRGLGAAAPGLLVVGLLLGARPVSSILDPPRRPREIAELVLRMGNMEVMSEVVGPDVGPRLVVMSVETYQLLSPLLVEPKQGARATDDGLLHLTWGRHDLIVLPVRDFTALPDQLTEANHLLPVLGRAHEALGVEPPAGGERVLVVDGGWRSQGMVDLIGLARDEPELGSITYVPGLMAIDLDFDAYRRVLERTR